ADLGARRPREAAAHQLLADVAAALVEGEARRGLAIDGDGRVLDEREQEATAPGALRLALNQEALEVLGDLVGRERRRRSLEADLGHRAERSLLRVGERAPGRQLR